MRGGCAFLWILMRWNWSRGRGCHALGNDFINMFLLMFYMSEVLESELQCHNEFADWAVSISGELKMFT